MKRLIIALLLPVACLAQEKGDNVIYVTPSDSTDLYKKVALFLQDKGYTITKSDKDLGYITTDFKNFKYSFNISINAQIQGNKVKFTSKMNNSLQPEHHEAVYYSTNKMLMFYKAWEVFNTLVMQFQNHDYYYAKQE